MSVRKLLLTGFVAVLGVLVVVGDASAIGKRKKKGCSSCSGGAVAAAPAPCGGCGGTAWAGGVPAGYAGIPPEAMPATGTAATNPQNGVTPAAGTTGGAVVPADGTVIPATGAITPGTVVVPAGGYYQNGQYVMPAGGYYQNGNAYPAGSGTRTGRGIFRR